MQMQLCIVLKKRAQKSVMEFPAMQFNLLREAERINANGRLD